jgi:nucleoside-diphosphate-sugar epimerase
MQPGDVPATYADVNDLARDVGFSPDTPIEVGVERFVRWYRDFYKAGTGLRATLRGASPKGTAAC